MPEHQVARAFGYLLDAPLWESWSVDSDGFHTQVVLSPSILRYQDFPEVIRAMQGTARDLRAGGIELTVSEDEVSDQRDDLIEWDAFISHASEDKDAFVRPLARELEARGLRVWYDESTLTVGDSLRRSIDRGLARSRFGIVVISPHFLEKEWPQKELDGLVAREIGGVKVILPVWHNITAQQIREHSPMLADRLAATSAKGLSTVIAELMQAIGRDAVPVVKPSSSKSRGSKAKPAIPTYSEHAKADVDFPLVKGSVVGDLIRDLRSYTWPVQRPAVEKLLELDWSTIGADETFVLGRNLYQAADGGERKALSVLKDFRRQAASMPADRAVDLLNGMLFEAYFNSKGEFRGSELKVRRIKELLALRGVKKFESSILFIRRELKPYWSKLSATTKF
ncbi:MAG: hypothetical protein C5B58_07185 [Acidobacteria bacterium]|nr:MAG: hypothetical protein C5B58_07185 [Acidobacteriota bacterium]